ncbi:hypothetical protein E6P74_05640 [Moraxella lacunata]|uniref:Uncharacterized protein n=1 Tax=Moraxella lacunata TaxID=477 RepID=A0A1B8Q8B4_MORLA|nr:hypothetical protein [Moraxella lacunata]MDI4482809.1 hypothetical protein [Moraxella lacunata]MDI4507234.1 hypothetical protein [Moraxella lacunata]OBX61377.1 hypothetical protein A9Z63_08035 [Moraxella lacunata]OBX67273.1 hypothetical protein A9309_01305 [Moraxella lacunata]
MWQLTNQTDILALHAQFIWADEFDWQELAQSDPVYTLTGAVDIQQGTKKAGRPITLDGTHTRTTRAELAKLQAWADVPELTLTLTHPKGKKYQVIFGRPAISDIKFTKPHSPKDESDEDKCTLNLHFLTI